MESRTHTTDLRVRADLEILTADGSVGVGVFFLQVIAVYMLTYK